MLVSVIIPVYNCEKYLKRAIDSALNQTLPKEDYQIIVVDDGSNDFTPGILRWFKDKITIVTLSKNHGTARALNEGISVAKGEWIKWLSADDEMLPDCLETLVNNATDHNTIYYTHYHIIDAESGHIRDFVEPGHEKDLLWSRYFGNGSSSFIHKDVFEKCGVFDESLGHSEDYDFWLRCTMLHDINITLIPFFTINYRYHAEQLTNKVGGVLDGFIKERIKNQLTTG